MPLRCPGYQSGFSLIELAVAASIYSMGLGSLSLMMMIAVEGTTRAGNEELATVQAASLAELILMNPGAVGHYISDPDAEPPDCDSGTICVPEEMAAWMLHHWRDGLAEALPGGTGIVCVDNTPGDGAPGDPACNGTGGPVVKLFWSKPEDGDDPDSGVGRQVARLPVP